MNKFPEEKIILEFDLLKVQDFLGMMALIICYPFATLSFLQGETTKENRLFNACLIEDIKNVEFESIKRYFVAKRIASQKSLKTVITWFENQSIERAFNFGLREAGFCGKIVGCQFFLNYSSYLNAYPSDLDRIQNTAPDVVLVNGKTYLRNLNKIKYEIGVALRYQNIFSFPLNLKVFENQGVVLLASYIMDDTKAMIKFATKLNTKIVFKVHPTQRPEMFLNEVNTNFSFAEKNLYGLFAGSSIFISTASGSAVEAVACGKSVIIIGSRDNLIACPLIDYGRGEIWDIVFDEEEMIMVFERIQNFRIQNKVRLLEIAKWYRANFFEENSPDFIKKFL